MTAETRAKFTQIVLEGIYVEKGMASFDDLLDKEDVDAIYAYLVARANEDWGRDS